MTDEEKFDVLKRDYIQKGQEHLKRVEWLTLEHCKVVGIKSNIAQSRHEVVSSYNKLLEMIVAVKTEVYTIKKKR